MSSTNEEAIQKGILEGSKILHVLPTMVQLDGIAGPIPAYLVESPVGNSYISLSHIRSNNNILKYEVGDDHIKCDNNHIFILKSITMADRSVKYFWSVQNTRNKK